MPGPSEQHPVTDTDLNWSSPHHTLGRGPTQAAPGTHTHNYEDIPGVPTPPNVDDYVMDAGDEMTGELTMNLARHKGVRFIELGSSPIEQRLIGMRTTTNGTVGIGVFKPPDDPTQPLMLQPFGVADPLQVEHAVSRGHLESYYLTGAPTLTSGWTAAGITLIVRSGWVSLGFRDLKKSTAPGTGDVMFTVPASYKPLLVEMWLTGATGNVAGGGSGAKTILMSLFSSTGQLQLRGNAMPLANEGVYGNISYPYN